MPVQLSHHAEMLNDHVRVQAFRDAIHEVVQPGDSVVDIGSGLGLLAASAVDAGARSVTAVEYLPQLAALSAHIIGTTPVEIMVGRSYDMALDPAPDVVVTETIGPIGPEENIVEIANDLKRRYPSIRRIIPHRLGLYAQAAFSADAAIARETVFSKIAGSAAGNFQPGPARISLDRAYSEQIYQDDLSDARAWSDKMVLADYVLGEAEVSDFTCDLVLSHGSEWNVVMIVFEADLGNSGKLTNHFAAPQTHWLNSYIFRPDGYSKVRISYESRDTSFEIQWFT
ncbi:MAG: 50S ribosomal protein L11 methyltransferase [Pseudomonadota bacterium]|uniref:50S ribosomal protein L11 methyltransferase n=1 Tax=Sphingomonas sp. ERG5 TaxID=1381597 RepID=UPI000A5C4566|nr:50S ribosomal protein L11 methyltransferase [Sphingomonas sp. ERG5]